MFDNGTKIYFLRDRKRYVHDYKTGEFLYELTGKGITRSLPLSADERVYYTSLKKDTVLDSDVGIVSFEEPRKPLAYLHSEMTWGDGVTLDGYSGVYQSFQDVIKVAIPGENKIVRYGLPAVDNKGKASFINNLSLYNTRNFIQKISD